MSLFTNDSATILADSVEAAPSYLLTSGNPKTAKGEGFGYLTGILHLAPAQIAGFEVCAFRTDGCTVACLNTAGRGGFDSAVQIARIRRTKWFRADKQAFMTRLEKDIRALVRKASRNGLKPCVRLNGTSDIPWESVRYINSEGNRVTLFETFPDVQFYDYTKNPTRFSKPIPANYDLTFSAADGNEKAVEFALSKGGRVAMVFRNAKRPNQRAKGWNLPATYNGVPLVDADKSDLRFLDPKGAILGLKVKGQAWKDETGFVKDITPA